jgi:hypothetical protein
VLEAVSFTLIRIGLLRKLSSLSNEEKNQLHGFRLAARVENLKKRFLMIEETLRNLDGINGIAKDDDPATAGR